MPTYSTLASAALLTLLAACTPPRPAVTAPATYLGITPCPDCAGVATALTLLPGGDYVLETRRLGTGRSAEVERGPTAPRRRDELLLYPPGGGLPYYLRLEGDTAVRWLAVWGQSLAADTTDAYVLAAGRPVRLGEGEREWFVDSAREPCDEAVGGGEACLRAIRPAGAGPADWEPVAPSVGGFAYVPGEVAHLVVREGPDGPALVRTVARARDVRLAVHDVYALAELAGDTLALPAGATRPTLELDVRGRRVLGTDGCNRYRGRLDALGADRLRFGTLAGTRRACPDAPYATDFLAALAATRGYRRGEGGSLVLVDGRGGDAAVLRRVD